MIEIIVFSPAGRSQSRMAQAIQQAIEANQLSHQRILLVHKPDYRGLRALLEIYSASREYDRLIIIAEHSYAAMMIKQTINWRQFVPIAMLAREDFALWVNTTSRLKTGTDWIAAARAAERPFRVGGNGAKSEDHLLLKLIARQTGTTLEYIPYYGSGAASFQLAGHFIDAHLNSVGEESANWRSKITKPLYVFSDKKIDYACADEKINKYLQALPTAKSSGLDIVYQSMRGIFMSGQASISQQGRYIELFEHLSETPEWKAYLAQDALKPACLAGKDFAAFLAAEEKRYEARLSECGPFAYL